MSGSLQLLLASIGLTLLVSAVAGVLADRLRLPGGAIVWAIGAAAALHLLVEGLVPLPPQLRFAAQVLVGVTLGATVTRSPVVAVWRLRRPLTACVVLLLAVCAAGGAALARLTPLDLRTALFAVAPGGANDMAVASLHFGVDGALVAGFQVVRQLFVFVLVPLVLPLLLRGDGGGSRATDADG